MKENWTKFSSHMTVYIVMEFVMFALHFKVLLKYVKYLTMQVHTTTHAAIVCSREHRTAQKGIEDEKKHRRKANL